MACGLPNSKLLVGTIIVLLFMFAYKIWKKKQKFFETSDESNGSKLDSLRDKPKNKKNTTVTDEVDTEKINMLVTDILRRQLPN